MVDDRVVGGAVFGIEMVGLPIAPADTVGSAPPPVETLAPLGPALAANVALTSNTRIAVSLFCTPVGSAVVTFANPAAGGSTTSTRLPTGTPTNALSRPSNSIEPVPTGNVSGGFAEVKVFWNV